MIIRGQVLARNMVLDMTIEEKPNVFWVGPICGGGPTITSSGDSVVESPNHDVTVWWRAQIMTSQCGGELKSWRHSVMESLNHDVTVQWRAQIMTSQCNGELKPWRHSYGGEPKDRLHSMVES